MQHGQYYGINNMVVINIYTAHNASIGVKMVTVFEYISITRSGKLRAIKCADIKINIEYRENVCNCVLLKLYVFLI